MMTNITAGFFGAVGTALLILLLLSAGSRGCDPAGMDAPFCGSGDSYDLEQGE